MTTTNDHYQQTAKTKAKQKTTTMTKTNDHYEAQFPGLHDGLPTVHVQLGNRSIHIGKASINIIFSIIILLGNILYSIIIPWQRSPGCPQLIYHFKNWEEKLS